MHNYLIYLLYIIKKIINLYIKIICFYLKFLKIKIYLFLLATNLFMINYSFNIKF